MRTQRGVLSARAIAARAPARRSCARAAIAAISRVDVHSARSCSAGAGVPHAAESSPPRTPSRYPLRPCVASSAGARGLLRRRSSLGDRRRAMLTPAIAHADPPPKATSPGGRGGARSSTPRTHASSISRAPTTRPSRSSTPRWSSIRTAKDLVFNLGVVHEKLGDIEDALRYFVRYEQMDLDPAGAREGGHLPEAPPRGPARRSRSRRSRLPPPPPPPPPAPPPQHGRHRLAHGGAAGLARGGLWRRHRLRSARPRRPPEVRVRRPTSDGLLRPGRERAKPPRTSGDHLRRRASSSASSAIAATAILFFARTRHSRRRRKGGPRAAPSYCLVRRDSRRRGACPRGRFLIMRSLGSAPAVALAAFALVAAAGGGLRGHRPNDVATLHRAR